MVRFYFAADYLPLLEHFQPTVGREVNISNIADRWSARTNENFNLTSKVLWSRQSSKLYAYLPNPPSCSERCTP